MERAYKCIKLHTLGRIWRRNRADLQDLTFHLCSTHVKVIQWYSSSVLSAFSVSNCQVWPRCHELRWPLILQPQSSITLLFFMDSSWYRKNNTSSSFMGSSFSSRREKIINWHNHIMVSCGNINMAVGALGKNKTKKGFICDHELDQECVPWARVDQVGQGFHGDQGRPVEGERGKRNQTVIGISINLHIVMELMQTVVLLQRRGGLGDCLENFSLHATLTYFPIHQLCVCVS